jgi:hypothetical protein
MFDSALEFYGYINQWGYAPDEGFFVPKFKDTITLDVTTFPFTGTANYASIYYANRYYFYFIEGMRYISEDLVEIDITMDVIQTYAYDICFYKYERTRKLINRWVGGKINRNYLRENWSTGMMQAVKVKYYNDPRSFSSYDGNDHTTGTIIFKYALDANANDWGSIIDYPFDSDFETLGRYKHYFLPMVQNKLRNSVSYIKPGEAGISYNDRQTFNQLTSKPLTKDVYYLPMSPFNFTSNPTQTALNSNDFDVIAISSECHPIGIKESGNVTSVVARTYSDNYDFDFRINSDPTALFSVNYVPAMLDENYMRIEFGESSALSTYPLYQLTADNCYLRYVPDVIDGTRIYAIISDNILTTVETGTDYNYTLKDPYSTIQRATNVLRFDIMTDAYEEWYTYNKGALVGALVQTVGGIGIAGAAGMAMQGAITDYSSVAYLNAKNAVDRSRVVQTENYRTAMNSISTGRQMASAGGGLIGWAQEGLNASMQPPICKQTGGSNGDRLANTVTILAREYRVNDFEEVARHYEAVGYRVHEFINSTGYGEEHQIESPWVRTRYYYDVVSIDNIAYFPDNFPLTTELDELIRDRFRKGFRAWHSYTNMGRTSLYINSRNLIMGCTCVYDNPEV